MFELVILTLCYINTILAKKSNIMKFIIRNQAGISNKYLRFAKWKILKLSRKYHELLYSEIYIKNISTKPERYEIKVKLGIPGPDIVVSTKAENLKSAWAALSSKMKRQLSRQGKLKTAY